MSFFHSLMAAGGVALPNYTSLSNLELYVSYEGLVINTTNDYGVVSGAGAVTTLKSLAPSTLGRDFTSTGTAPTLTADGIVFGGAGRLTGGVASLTWANFLHYNATAANYKSTVRAVVKFGTGSNPNTAYGILGNNAASASNKGICFYFDDRASSSRNNAFGSFFSAGTGVTILSGIQDEVIIPNQFCLLTIETRLDISINVFRQSVYLNGILQGVAVTSASTALVTTPTFNLEIGTLGNNIFPLVGTIKEITIQSNIDNVPTRLAFDTAIINKYGITVQTTLPTVDVTRTALQIYDTQNDAGKYYLSAGLDINPRKPYLFSKYFTYGDSHIPAGERVIKHHKSLNYGLTFDAPVIIYAPAGDLNPGDMGGGYSANGRLHIFCDVRTLNAPPWFTKYLYSDNDGTSFTEVDLTSIMPDPTLDQWAMYGNLIENNGVLMYPFYKVKSDLSQSANYIFRSTNGGANWSVVTVRAPGATYINEATIIGLDATHILYIARNEVTFEWTQYMSSDNGLTWVDQGDLAYGLVSAFASPCRLNKFRMVNSDVIVNYFLDRPNNRIYGGYALPANLIASGVSAWVGVTLMAATGRRPHYGDYCHPMNNFNAICGTAYEQATIDLSDNDFITASMLSTHYATVKTALGI